MALTKGFVKNAGTTALDTRLMDAAKLVSSGSGAVRQGTLTVFGAYGDQTDLVVSGSGMAVVVRRATFVTSRSAADGAVVFTNNGSTAVPLEAAPAANSRIDVVYVKHNDDYDGNGDTSALPVFGVVKGDAAASPVKKSVPTGALELAEITVPAGATSANSSGVSIRNVHPWTAPVNGVVNYRTMTELQADLAVANPGQQAFVFADSSLWQRVTGAGWRCIYHPAFNRNYNRQYERTNVSTSVTLGTVTLPAMPFGFRAIVKVMGTGGGNGAAGGTFGVSLGISGGGVTASDGWNSRADRYRPYYSQGAQASIARMTRVDVPANTESTITVAADSTIGITLSLVLDIDCYIGGEY